MTMGDVLEIRSHGHSLNGTHDWRQGAVGSATAQQAAWYAVHTRPRHEKQVGERLKGKGLEVFLPLIRRGRVYGKRRVEVDVPLFSCYLFVKSPPDRLLDVGWTRGLIRILGAENGRYTAVPPQQIDSLRTALDAGLRLDPHPYLEQGHRVRVKCGPLAGVEGVLVRRDRHHRLAIAIDLIAKAAALIISADNVEPV